MAIREQGKHFRIGEMWRGLYLDAHIYSEDNFHNVENLINLEDCKILLDKKSLASSKISELKEYLKKPVPKLEEWDIKLRKSWIKKCTKDQSLVTLRDITPCTGCFLIF